jgi:3'(2'), 5'-bisphosphate nucleotidase
MDKLIIAKNLSLVAGEEILNIYSSGDFGTTEKSDKSPLTKADLTANEVIVSTLGKAFPDFGILTEEESDDLSRLDKEYVWIIDPLDGTKEFIKRNGEFTVNIGLCKNGEPVLGVVYAPAKDELFFAEKSKGAFYQKGKEISKITASNKSKISDMTLACSRSHSGEKEASIQNLFVEVIPTGSSLKGCLIAKGDADAYFRFGPVHEWDICAMDAILRGAGGLLTDFSGNPIKYNQKDTLIKGFLASNGKIHGELLRLANE